MSSSILVGIPVCLENLRHHHREMVYYSVPSFQPSSQRPLDLQPHKRITLGPADVPFLKPLLSIEQALASGLRPGGYAKLLLVLAVRHLVYMYTADITGPVAGLKSMTLRYRAPANLSMHESRTGYTARRLNSPTGSESIEVKSGLKLRGIPIEPCSRKTRRYKRLRRETGKFSAFSGADGHVNSWRLFCPLSFRKHMVSAQSKKDCSVTPARSAAANLLVVLSQWTSQESIRSDKARAHDVAKRVGP